MWNCECLTLLAALQVVFHTWLYYLKTTYRYCFRSVIIIGMLSQIVSKGGNRSLEPKSSQLFTNKKCYRKIIMLKNEGPNCFKWFFRKILIYLVPGTCTVIVKVTRDDSQKIQKMTFGIFFKKKWRPKLF